MKIVSVSGSTRSNVGKKDAKALRVQGLVPCVVYGGEKQIHFQTDEKSLMPIFYSPEVCFVELNLDGKVIKSIPQDIQFHKVTDKITHVDFLELNDKKNITMAVPVHTTGSSAGVLKGGKLVKNLRKMRVTALPANMPERIEIDITPLEIGDHIKVSEIKTNNFTFNEAASSKVVAIRATRNAIAAAAAESKK